MEQYVVKGGVPLRGKVSIGGAKNAASCGSNYDR